MTPRPPLAARIGLTVGVVALCVAWPWVLAFLTTGILPPL